MEDKLIRWARPSIIWLGMALMALTDVILPTASQIFNLSLPKLSLDPNFWDAWTLVVGIYAGGRSLEKIGLPKRKDGPQSESQGGKEIG